MKAQGIAVAAGVALLLSGSSLVALPTPLPDALAPDRIAASLCGARVTGGALMRELLVASAYAAPASRDAPIPLYADLTRSPFPVSTKDAAARRYFSQGLLLTYGFSHAGAVRSFREAQRLDPDCAACWWGEAAALGPNINAPMDDRDRPSALAALDRAMALRDRASPMERALIEALSTRYARDAGADRAALDAAYADAMLAVARRFPDDNDVAVLAAEAAMDTSPWNYWQADRRTPISPRIAEAVRLMETVQKRTPDHPQAGHLYIHLLEASDPARAEAAADRLRRSGPGSAGHLVHMPGHIYMVRGRYADSIRVNIAAARADEAFIRRTDDHSLLRYGYYPHNVHFIVTSAQMAGDMQTALREAQRLRGLLDADTSAAIGWIQAIDAAPYLTMAQFAAPQAILTMPAPDPRLAYAAGMRHYARAIASAEARDTTGFNAEISAIETLKSSTALDGIEAQGVPARDLLSIAVAVAKGRRAMLEGRPADAVPLFRAAAVMEARLPYQEPPFWYYPVRQSLGAALFLSGRYEEAGQAFREALAQTPNNGWALYGLYRTEAALGRYDEAAAARAAFARAWGGKASWLRMERL